MSNKILMPSGGQTVDEMMLQKWYKKVGDSVKRGDILFEIETDKAILTVESFASGTLLEIKYPEGVMVRTGEVVAIIGERNEKPIEAVTENPMPEIMPILAEKKQSNAASSVTTPIPEKQEIPNFSKKILASPLAKNFARIENINLEDVAKFVSKNQLSKIDVDNFRRNGNLSKELTAREDVRFIDTSSMRRTIARRMKESVATSPHYFIAVEIEMTQVIHLRNKLNKNIDLGSSKISYNDIIMKVVAKAIGYYPLINSSYEGDKIKIHTDVHFGLAIAIESGIIVPVVRQVNSKSIPEIAANNGFNIEKVRTNNIREQDIKGGTITLSNLGMTGINYFTAIINQPESCILAVGGIIKKVVVVEDAMVIRDMMNLTGSFDHRTVDGAVGAAFLMKVKAILEDPELLLL